MPVHDYGGHVNHNRTLPLIPFLNGSGTGANKNYMRIYDLRGGGQWGALSFQIPVGFVAFVSAIVGIIPTGTGTFDWTAGTEELDAGEVLTTDEDTATADGQAGTDSTLLELDITAAFDGLTLAVGDWVGLNFIADVLDTLTAVGLVGLSVELEMDA